MGEETAGIVEGNQDQLKPCFPVRDESVQKVKSEIQHTYEGNLGKLVLFEETQIVRDQYLKEFVDKAFGQFEQIGDLDRAAFLDGAAYVHRILREQGDIPLMRETPDDALDRETKFYEELADKNNETLGDTLNRAQDFVVARFPELLETEFGRELKRMTDEHPIKPSFAIGADMMYSVLKNADLQTLADTVGLDDEIDNFFRDK